MVQICAKVLTKGEQLLNAFLENFLLAQAGFGLGSFSPPFRPQFPTFALHAHLLPIAHVALLFYPILEPLSTIKIWKFPESQENTSEMDRVQDLDAARDEDTDEVEIGKPDPSQPLITPPPESPKTRMIDESDLPSAKSSAINNPPPAWLLEEEGTPVSGEADKEGGQ